jgi:hypothetical protein
MFRLPIRPARALLALVSLVALAMCFFGVRALAIENFTLGPRDKIIAEAPGCHVECAVQGQDRRVCILKSFDCKVTCQDLPECSVPGVGTMKVCAVVRKR